VTEDNRIPDKQDPCIPCADAGECVRPDARDCVVPSFLKDPMLKQLAAIPRASEERAIPERTEP
jgi:hypothetical protein